MRRLLSKSITHFDFEGSPGLVLLAYTVSENQRQIRI